MADYEENITKLMEVSGVCRSDAEYIFALNDCNLERAINYHLENEGNLTSASNCDGWEKDLVKDSPSMPELDAEVRAPIPPKREQLITPGDDNFRFRKRRANAAFGVCPLRNFQREAEIQEEKLRRLLEGDQQILGCSSSSSHGSRTQKKASRLEDLFRPPVDLLFWGNFQTARDYAASQNKWLIVNLQDNAQFKSQVVNRDIWTHTELRKLVEKHFVLWQVSVDNDDGFRFKTFYHVNDVPYICVIDPRTGEEKIKFNIEKAETLLSELLEFINENSTALENNTNSSSSKRCDIAGPSTSCEANNTKTIKGENERNLAATELSEEEQLMLAMQNSLRETTYHDNELRNNEDSKDADYSKYDEDSKDIDDYVDSSTENVDLVPQSAEENNESVELTKIQLRLPDGDRIIIEMPSTSKLRALKTYIKINYPEIVKTPYKLITAFPRQDILTLDENMNFIDAKLHPTAILHLHKDD